MAHTTENIVEYNICIRLAVYTTSVRMSEWMCAGQNGDVRALLRDVTLAVLFFVVRFTISVELLLPNARMGFENSRSSELN